MRMASSPPASIPNFKTIHVIDMGQSQRPLPTTFVNEERQREESLFNDSCQRPFSTKVASQRPLSTERNNDFRQRLLSQLFTKTAHAESCQRVL